jgi:hypothetical protein
VLAEELHDAWPTLDEPSLRGLLPAVIVSNSAAALATVDMKKLPLEI